MKSFQRLQMIFLLGLLNCTACSKLNFSSPTPLNLSSMGITQLAPTVVNTKKNHPITFPLNGTTDGKKLGTLSFSQTQAMTSLTSANGGTFQIVDNANYIVKYTPKTDWLGQENVTIYATDTFGNAVPGAITVNVGNVLNSIQAAFAVRGPSCITCHAAIASNVVTDYGYDNNWFFDTTSSDSFYYDRLGTAAGLATLNLENSSKFVVPKVDVPSAAVQAQFNITTLAQFVQARFAQGTTNKASQVSEVSSVKISIPTVARIQTVFNNPTPNQVYLPDTASSPALSGLVYDATNNIFVISNLVCDGDLYLAAPVLFENATVQSINGCRIYATATIVSDGVLKSAAYGTATKYNTQLLSAESIWFGVGKMNDAQGAFCDVATSWYGNPDNTAGKDCKQAANASVPNCDSFNERLSAIIDRNTFTRGYADATSLKALMANPLRSTPGQGTIYKVRLAMEAHLGRPLYDSSCSSSGGRNQELSRLLLAAPYVNARYTGNISGSTVAEAAIMSLNTFKFSFDPVFSSVSIFSLLDDDELVSLPESEIN